MILIARVLSIAIFNSHQNIGRHLIAEIREKYANNVLIFSFWYLLVEHKIIDFIVVRIIYWIFQTTHTEMFRPSFN